MASIPAWGGNFPMGPLGGFKDWREGYKRRKQPYPDQTGKVAPPSVYSYTSAAITPTPTGVLRWGLAALATYGIAQAVEAITGQRARTSSGELSAQLQYDLQQYLNSVRTEGKPTKPPNQRDRPTRPVVPPIDLEPPDHEELEDFLDWLDDTYRKRQYKGY